MADAAEAELLSTAFNRFVELHGRVVCDPQSRCALQGGHGAPDRPRAILVTFWSPRAAAAFDRFWDSYRRVYGTDRAWDFAMMAS